MSLTIDDVKNTAHLARLAFNEQELPKHAKNLSNILDLIDQMSNTDTKNVQPMSHPLDLSQPLRADEVTERDEHGYYQKLAAKTDAGLYLVPLVIE